MIKPIDIEELPRTGYSVALAVAQKVNEIITLLNNEQRKTIKLEEIEQDLKDDQA